MAQMIDIGKYGINADHVVSVTKPQKNKGRILIELDTGQVIETDEKYFRTVMGKDYIRQIAPVKGCYAQTEDYDGSILKEPVHALANTADADIRPLDVTQDVTEFFDDFCNYKGIVWDDNGQENAEE